MDEIEDNETLSQAMTVWIGVGYGSTPRRSDERLIEVFGEERAATLLPQLDALRKTFYRTDAMHTAAGMAEMGRKAKADFRPQHPEISEEAVSALAWIYVWNNK